VDKREQIIVSAMVLFIENGVQATPMSAIAKKANSGMGTIYNYFTTKEELINAIYIYIKQDEVRNISSPIDNNSIKRQFEHFCRALISYFVNNPLHFRFMDQFQSSPVITEATKNEGAAAFGAYLALIVQGQEQGIIKSIGIEEIMQFVMGGIMGFIRWILTSGKPLTDALMDNQLRIAWDALKE